MKKTNILLIALIFIFFFSSCNNDDDCGSPSWVTPNNLENEYGCVDTKYLMDIELSDDHTIIRSQEIFDSQITGNCTPQIDFSTYVLAHRQKGA